MIRIAICIDYNDWHEKFNHFISLYNNRSDVILESIRINDDDWLEKLEKVDAIIWRSSNMGPEASAYYKEKVYFIEQYLRKMIMPNYSSVWHFDSKAAQSYVFKHYGIPTPKTIVSFDLENALALLEQAEMPLVAKETFGAASTNVRLISSKTNMKDLVRQLLSSQALAKEASKYGREMFRYLKYFKKYFWRYMFEAKFVNTNQRCVYWQELVPGNSRDLRITVIGDRYAFGFWRNNRPNDFRASGSGNIDYCDPVPTDVILNCIELNRKFDFDSMAYDIVFSDGNYKIIEMSYGYIDTAIYNAPGYYHLNNDELEFTPGNYWPQELWVKWLLHRIEQKFGEDSHA